MARREKHDGVNYEEDLDQIDFNNYKGMFFNDDPGQKYQDEVTGAHFEYRDMCRRLRRLQKEVQIEESTTAPKEIIESGIQKPPNESGQAFHTLHSLLVLGQTKESRNGTQGLPQQGYGTVGAYYAGNNKDPAVRPHPTEPKNFRQFSSQLDPPAKSYAPAKPTHGQGPNRSKSIDKTQPFAMAKPQACTKTVQKPSKPPTNATSNAKRGTFYDLYFGKSIEQLLEEKMKTKPVIKNSRPGTNHRTKTLHLGVDKTVPKRAIEATKSRNAASRAQDRKTYEAKPDKKQERFLYQTTAESLASNKQRQLRESLVGSNKKVIKDVKKEGNDKLKKLKVSLMGVEAIPTYSRNMIPVKTSIKEIPKDKGLQMRKNQIYGGSKRAYVASLLQPSASMKK